MSKRFFNLVTHGEYEYAAQVIELNNELFSRTREDISRIINIDNIDQLHGADLELYQTYVHEMTHFLDSTTTLWGLEFTCRMYRWFKYRTEESLKVVALNDSEITMHNHLSENSNQTLNFSQIKFSLEYSDKVGMYVHFHYLNESGNPLQSVPLSMLSLFEGHAYAQEKLIICKRFENNDDLVSLKLLENEINNTIKQLGSSEYTGLLALVMQQLPTVKLSRKLELICIIVNFCLNVPSFYIGMTPEYLLKAVFSGAPDKYISALKMELSRSSNRSILSLVVFFAILIQVESDMSKLNEFAIENIELFVLKIFANGDEASDELYENMQELWLLEFEMYSKICSEVGANLALLMVEQKTNLGWRWSPIESYHLPSILLPSGEQVSYKKDLGVDMYEHFEKMLDKSMSLETELNNYGIKREHLSPEFHHGWLNHIKTGGSALYVHDVGNEL